MGADTSMPTHHCWILIILNFLVYSLLEGFLLYYAYCTTEVVVESDIVFRKRWSSMHVAEILLVFWLADRVLVFWDTLGYAQHIMS